MSAPAASSLLPVYAPAPEAFVRGEGMHLIADDGRRYLDFTGGIAVNAFGHANPTLIAALTAQAHKVWHVSNQFRSLNAEALAQKYVEATFADFVFFTNSGTEAIECALKMARKHFAAKNEPERVEIIGFSGSFHGRSYAAINASGNPSYLEGFGPALPGYVHVPFGDRAALEAAINPRTGGVIIEPVQGEGGCRAASDDDLRYLRGLCDQHGILLILDEVQCGAGRTGKLFAHEWAGVTPDIMAVAKGVGGGFPLGACLATQDAAAGMTRATHGSTYGGNPLATAVGLAAFDMLTADGFLAHVRDMSNHLGQALEGLKDRHQGLALELRGKGLLRGLKLNGDPKPFQAAARAQGLLVGVASDNVLRLTPPLTVEAQHISEAAEKLDAVLSAGRTA